ncbi:MAG: 50S ribosomal protein L24 [Candidatus Moranbacteria bacterium]|nr:50S ribosomal protein L24 [Candidatus Moranbacteria bacterium]
MLGIRKNDQVVVLAGKDKGKSGRVIEVDYKKDRVIVESVNKFKKAQRRTQTNPQGGFIDIEKPIHVSNVALIDKKTNKPTRIGIKILKDGTKVRISKRSGEVI